MFRIRFWEVGAITPKHVTETGFGSFLVLVLWRIAFLAHGLAAHFDAVSVVNQTVQDAIGDGGIADLLMTSEKFYILASK